MSDTIQAPNAPAEPTPEPESGDPRVELANATEEEAELLHRALVEIRLRKAREEASRAVWKSVLAELSEALGSEEDNAAAKLFVAHALNHGWQEDDELHTFAVGLPEALGWRLSRPRGGGLLWKRSED